MTFNDVITLGLKTDECTAYRKDDVAINYCCPHCNVSYYRENFMDTTCVYYPPIYKDGVNINPDRNTTTVHCTCLNCGKDFSFTR